MSCSAGDERVCVTYHLSILSDEPYEVFIAYRDSNEYVTLRTDKDWSKEVHLPKGSYASLLAIPHRYTGSDKTSEVLLSGQIIYKKKILKSLDKNVISIVMPNL